MVFCARKAVALLIPPYFSRTVLPSSRKDPRQKLDIEQQVDTEQKVGISRKFNSTTWQKAKDFTSLSSIALDSLILHNVCIIALAR